MARQINLPKVDSAEGARAFLLYLSLEGLLFHPEEPAAGCLEHHKLAADQIAQIDAAMKATFDYLEDPCETALSILQV